MTALIVFSDTRRPQPTAPNDEWWPYLSDGDRRMRKGWDRPEGQLWDRLAEVGHDHDMGGCTCGCPVVGCEPCGGFKSTRARLEEEA